MGWGDRQVFRNHPQMRLFLVTRGEFEREITNSLFMHHGRQFSVQCESPSGARRVPDFKEAITGPGRQVSPDSLAGFRGMAQLPSASSLGPMAETATPGASRRPWGHASLHVERSL